MMGSVRFSRDRPRFTDTLDMIKFLCKDVWQLVFRKQIDNLKTNHRVRSLALIHKEAMETLQNTFWQLCKATITFKLIKRSA